MNAIKIKEACAFARRALLILTFNCKSSSISTQVPYIWSGRKGTTVTRIWNSFWFYQMAAMSGKIKTCHEKHRNLPSNI